MANSTGPDPLSPEERRAVLREHLEREKERRRVAEAKLSAIAERLSRVPAHGAYLTPQQELTEDLLDIITGKESPS